MGVILCERHGTQSFAWGCNHVYPAMKSNAPLSVDLWRGPLFDIWVCESCMASGCLPTTEDDFFDDRFDDLFGPTCAACFSEWRVSMGFEATLKTHAMEVKEFWDCIATTRSKAFQSAPPFPNGARASEIDAAEIRWNLHLPSTVRETYLLHDGTDRAYVLPVVDPFGWDAHRLLSIAEIDRTKRTLDQLLESGDFDDAAPDSTDAVRELWWNRRWLPFTDNGGGDHCCIDFDPGWGGLEGQVILWDHERGPTAKLEPSFYAFVMRIVDRMKSGVHRFDAKGWLIQE